MAEQRPSLLRNVFEVVSTVAMVALAAAVVWQGMARSSGAAPDAGPRDAVAIPATPIAINGSPVVGDVAAKVAMVEFADFECSFCAKFAREIMPELQRDYIETGRVVFVYKHFPLASHANAEPAARASWCAHRQGRFWQFHDQLFDLRGELGGVDVKQIAKRVGVSGQEFESCMAGASSVDAVRADREEGESLNVNGTPRFFFGVVGDGRINVTAVLSGTKPVGAFRIVLDKLLQG